MFHIETNVSKKVLWFYLKIISQNEKSVQIWKIFTIFVIHLKLRVMKKRSFYAILLVAIGLFISTGFVLQAVNSSNSFNSSQSYEGVGGGGNSGSAVNGVYVPD